MKSMNFKGNVKVSVIHVFWILYYRIRTNDLSVIPFV